MRTPFNACVPLTMAEDRSAKPRSNKPILAYIVAIVNKKILFEKLGKC